MILLIGHKGSMGERYKAILAYLGQAVVGLDAEHNMDTVKHYMDRADGVIIASPTETHAKYIYELAEFGKPILCEKPVSKNIQELRELMAFLREERCSFRMMNQYKMLADPNRIGITKYNYFRSGKDGLVWDCMNVIGLAKSMIQLRNDSPMWTCFINGKALNIRDMDPAYVGYVKMWLGYPSQDLGEILATHEKTNALALSGKYDWKNPA